MPAIQLERSAVRRNKPTKIVWCLYCIRLGCTSCAMYTPCIEWGSQVTNISSNPHQTLLLKYAHFPPPPSSMSMSMCIHVMLHCVHKPKRARSFNFNHFDFLWQFLRAHRWDVSFLLRFESNLWEIEWKSPEIEASMSMSTMKNIQKKLNALTFGWNYTSHPAELSCSFVQRKCQQNNWCAKLHVQRIEYSVNLSRRNETKNERIEFADNCRVLGRC